jgi:acetolactate synthase-1/2/3 large subunit
MKMTVAQVVFRYLKQRGVRHIFGVSGHSVFDLTDAIYQEPDLDFVPAQIEVGAGYMANGYARGARGLSVNLISGGPGATNAVTGVAMAQKESYPLLLLSSDVERKLASKGASNYHGMPHVDVFSPITKMAVMLDRPEDIGEVMQDAVRTATSGRFGPVFVGIPTDLQTAEVDVPAFPWDESQPQPLQPDRALIARATEELARASAPIIIAGGGVYWAQADPELVELAELLGAPFGTTPSYKGMISEDHPLSLGGLGSGGAPHANKLATESDLILALGTTFSEALTLRFSNRVIPERPRIIHIDIDPAEIGKTYPAEIAIVADAKAALRALIDQLRANGAGPAPRAAHLERMQREKAAWRVELAKRGEATGGPINRWQLYRALREVMDDDAIIVAEGATGEMLQMYVARAQVFHGGEYQPIGHGLGTSLGLKQAFPQRQVVCVSGDGSFMMEMQELCTAMRAKLPIVSIVVRNGAYGGMKRDQIREYDGRVIGTDLHVPDLPLLAQSFGIYGARVERPADLPEVLAGALAAGRPALVDVVSPMEGI